MTDSRERLADVNKHYGTLSASKQGMPIVVVNVVQHVSCKMRCGGASCDMIHEGDLAVTS